MKGARRDGGHGGKLANPWGLTACQILAMRAFARHGRYTLAASELCVTNRTVEAHVGRARVAMGQPSVIAALVKLGVYEALYGPLATEP